MGMHTHPNGKEVRRSFDVENVGELLDLLEKDLPDFTETLVELPSGTSGKYQSVGIHKIEKKSQGGYQFHQFEVGFIYREQENLETYDMEDETIENIEINGSKYRHLRLHFSIVADDRAIVLDNKCFSGPTTYLLNKKLSPLITPTTYNVFGSDGGERLRIKVIPIPKEDFSEVLSAQFKKMSEINLEFAKPGKGKTAALPEGMDLDEERSKVAEITESIFASVLGQQTTDEIALDQLPVKSIRVSIKLDERSGTAAQRNTMRASAKQFFREYQDSFFLNEASFAYKSESGELERALLNSAKVTEECSVKAEDYGDSAKMWAAQRTSFVRLKGAGKI